MPIIKNISRRVLLLRFNSGSQTNLGANDPPLAVPHSEVRANRYLEKLRNRGLLSLNLQEAATAEKGAASVLGASKKPRTADTSKADAKGKKRADGPSSKKKR